MNPYSGHLEMKLFDEVGVEAQKTRPEGGIFGFVLLKLTLTQL